MIESDILSARLLRPYYSRALAALVPVARPGLKTVAVDRWWRLYYDPEFMDSLSARHRAGVIACHEIEHLLRRHSDRCGCRDHRAWNVAGDAEINDDADQADLPPNGVTPSLIGRENGLLAEEYYDPAAVGEICGGGSGAGGVPIDGELGPSDGIDEVAAERIRDDVAADIRRHVAAHGVGSVPLGIRVWADDRPEVVQLPWPSRLSAALARHSQVWRSGRDVPNWNRLSRRYRHGEPLRPGTRCPQPRIGIVVDTSGSMSADGSIVLGAIASIVRRYGDVIGVGCDVAATKPVRVTSKTKWIGGGGTDLQPGVDALTSMVDILVIVSDGDAWPYKPTLPTVTIGIGASTPEWSKTHIALDSRR